MKKMYIKSGFLILLILLVTITVTSVSATDTNMSNIQENDFHEIQSSEQPVIDDDNQIVSNNDEVNRKKDSHMFFYQKPNTMVRNETEEFKVSLWDDNDEFIVNQTLILQFNNETFTSDNFVDNMYVFDYTPNKHGLLNVKVTFPGNDEYNPVSIKDTWEVMKPLMPLEVAIFEDRIKLGETVKLRGIISNIIGYQYEFGDAYIENNPNSYLDFYKNYYLFRDNYFEGKDVFITFNNETYTTQVKDNTFLFDYTPKEAGYYNLSVKIDETERYRELTYEDTFTVSKNILELYVQQKDINTQEMEVNFVAFLTERDSMDNVLNQTLTVSYDGEYFDVSSDDEGYFYFTLKQKRNDFNYYTVHFEGKDEYEYNDLMRHGYFDARDHSDINSDDPESYTDDNNITIHVIPNTGSSVIKSDSIESRNITSKNSKSVEHKLAEYELVEHKSAEHNHVNNGLVNVESTVDQSINNLTDNKTNNTDEKQNSISDLKDNTNNMQNNLVLLSLIILLILVVIYLAKNRK